MSYNYYPNYILKQYSLMKRIIILAIILISIQNSNQIDYTIEGLSPGNCELPYATKYTFTINGKCQQTCSTSNNKFTLDLETSKKQRIKAECVTGLIRENLSCSIDTSPYPLDNVNIILPAKAPTVEIFTFTNWDKTIGANPGTSNVLKNIKCVPETTNTFIPSSITDIQCDEFLGNTFNINGDWEDKSRLSSSSISGTFSILLDNDNQNATSCIFVSEPIRFFCTYYGNIRLKIKDQAFTANSGMSFKIKAYDSGKTLDCTDNDDDWDFPDDIAISLNLNKVFIVICLLLF